MQIVSCSGSISLQNATLMAWCLALPILWIPTPGAVAQPSGTAVTVRTPRLTVRTDLASGLTDYAWTEGPDLRGASCGATLADGTALNAADYPTHECGQADAVRVMDEFGTGRRITIHHRAPGRPELRQHLWVYDDLPYCFASLDIVNVTPISSNSVAPLVVDATRTPGAGLHLKTGDKPRSLFVPFDNDKFVRYNSDHASDSYEVTAIYDNASRHGFVLGSVNHDTWKTGISIRDVVPQAVGNLRVYGGATGEWTHDTQPHGFVSGTTISSPRIFIGYFADWRAGLEAYGRANARVTPALAWHGGVPFGWNSWAASGKNINYDRYVAVSDFFKQKLEPAGFSNNGRVTINFDSYWDNLSEAQLVEAARHAHANGQGAGIYWTPFTYWGDDLTRKVEGTGGRYTYGEALLKDGKGQPLPKLDGGRPLDPSHPATLQRIDWQLRRFVQWGYDFVKLDFINCGALEGAHYDPRITTGVAAYNRGMKRIADDLAPQRIDRPFFISLSIAPLFPGGYAHSRRVSCDAFGALKDTEYMLNSLSYGWWINGTIYPYNDPDHTVLSASETEARSRLNASVIAGTVILDSDDLTKPEMQERALRLLTNPSINTLARQGRTFRSVEGDTGPHAADVFVRDAGSGTCYVAVFNYDARQKVARHLELARLGFSGLAKYRVRDLWSNQVRHAQGTLAVELEPGESTILECVKE